MAEQRKKTHGILLRVNSKIISLELFDAAQWPNRASAEGLWRVRVDGAWHAPTDKYSFLTIQAVGELLVALLTGGAACLQAEPAPWLPWKAEVSIYLESEPDSTRGSVHAPPHQEADGRWWVWVWVYSRGPIKLPCDDVKLIRVR